MLSGSNMAIFSAVGFPISSIGKSEIASAAVAYSKRFSYPAAVSMFHRKWNIGVMQQAK